MQRHDSGSKRKLQPWRAKRLQSLLEPLGLFIRSQPLACNFSQALNRIALFVNFHSIAKHNLRVVRKFKTAVRRLERSRQIETRTKARVEHRVMLDGCDLQLNPLLLLCIELGFLRSARFMLSPAN